MILLEQLIPDADTCRRYYYESGVRKAKRNGYIDFRQLIDKIPEQHVDICDKEELTVEYIRGFLDGTREVNNLS